MNLLTHIGVYWPPKHSILFFTRLPPHTPPPPTAYCDLLLLIPTPAAMAMVALPQLSPATSSIVRFGGGTAASAAAISPVPTTSLLTSPKFSSKPTGDREEERDGKRRE